MKNKVLIKVIFPEIEEEFDIFVPVNEQVWKVNRLITKSIFDLTGLNYDPRVDDYVLLNKATGNIYKNNQVIIDTDIRNGTELILLATSKS